MAIAAHASTEASVLLVMWTRWLCFWSQNEVPLYVRLAGKNPGWDESSDKRDLLETLEEVEAQEEEQKRIRKTQNQSGNTHHSGKGSGKNGGK